MTRSEITGLVGALVDDIPHATTRAVDVFDALTMAAIAVGLKADVPARDMLQRFREWVDAAVAIDEQIRTNAPRGAEGEG
jgi:hypothetical protein